MLRSFWLHTCFYFVVCLAYSTVSIAQNIEAETQVEFDPVQVLKLVDKTSKKYDENAKESALRETIKLLLGYVADANACVKDKETMLEELTKSLEMLGESTKADSDEVIQQRKLLKKEKESVESGLADCRLIALQAGQAAERFKKTLQLQLEHELFTLTPPAWRIVTHYLPMETWSFDKDKFLAKSGVQELREWHGWVLVSILFLALGISLPLPYFLRKRKPRSFLPDATFLDKLFDGLVVHFSKFSFPILLFGGFSLFVFFIQYKTSYFSFLGGICYGGLAYSVFLWVNRVLLVPISGAPLVHLALTDAKRISKQLSILSTGLFLCFLLFVALLSQALSTPWLMLVRDVLVTVFSILLFWLVWLIGRISALSGRVRVIRLAFLIILPAILVAEWVGYRNFAEYLLISVVKTIGVLGVFWLVINLLRDLFEGIAEGEHPWQHRIRDMLGLKANEKQPGVYWLYLMITLVLWLGLFFWLLRIWGLSEANFSTLYLYAMEGIRFAGHTIVPIHIVSGILTFFVALVVFYLIRDRFVKKWLIRTRVERGAREAIVSIIGYVGFILAFLIGLSVSGVDFSNFALIAGALSVGIGFGLQNVVNNFISGIILLFERPVKTGDWVRVGQTEGYVRKISIRTTQIQTFDRADVIVPNSDLISSQVTNRMLRDPYGRVSVKVSVAYGSDVQLVKKLLLEIAGRHPLVIKNELVAPAPQVYFSAFGENGLEFDLRAVIYDIDHQLETISDFHFAIEEAFRFHRIHIPYPQRDVHIRNLDEMKARLQDKS